MSEELPPITGTLSKNSMANPSNMLNEGVSGVATGTVSGPPVGVEAMLASMGLGGAPLSAQAAPRAEPMMAKPEFFTVNIVGPRGDQYVSNGDVSVYLERNKDVRVSARVLEALKASEGVQFTFMPTV